MDDRPRHGEQCDRGGDRGGRSPRVDPGRARPATSSASGTATWATWLRHIGDSVRTTASASDEPHRDREPGARPGRDGAAGLGRGRRIARRATSASTTISATNAGDRAVERRARTVSGRACARSRRSGDRPPRRCDSGRTGRRRGRDPTGPTRRARRARRPPGRPAMSRAPASQEHPECRRREAGDDEQALDREGGAGEQSDHDGNGGASGCASSERRSGPRRASGPRRCRPRSGARWSTAPSR